MNYIVTAIIIILFFFSIKKNDNFLNKRTSDVLKGIAILFIILHHIFNEIGYPNHLGYISCMGYLGTGFFFFMSGYGNWISINKDKELRIKWLTKRLWRLYQIFIPCFFVFLLVIFLVNQMNIYYSFDVKNILGDLLKFSLPNTINWFPKVFIISIILFYLITKLIKKEILRIIIIFLLTFIYIFVCAKIVHLEEYWYNSISCFALGCVIAKYKNNIVAFLESINISVRVLLLLVGGIVTIIWPHIETLVGMDNPISRIIHANILCITILLFTTVFSCHSRMLEFCGKYSFEIYIIHICFLKTFILLKVNSNLLIIGTFIGTLISAVLYYFLTKKVRKQCIKQKC